MNLKAPFPYFGGKSKIAAEVWRRFGDVPNYVEPFFGSGAVLLGRPPFDGYRTETVNDADGHLANFWRALKHDPDGVAEYADWPVSELDLHARGDWLYCRPDAHEWVERLRADPDYYDVKSAGWWVWFVSSWIGGLPSIDAGQGVNRKRPHLGNMGRGVNRQLPHLSDAGRGEALRIYMRQLTARLERVRIACGDWSRVTGPSVTWKHGVTAVFLDPPYSHAERAAQLYSQESATVAAEVREWAIENGDNPKMRIALCSYGEAPLPAGWSRYNWKADGGYGSQGDGRGRKNRHRETIDFSPHCLSGIQASIFEHI